MTAEPEYCKPGLLVSRSKIDVLPKHEAWDATNEFGEGGCYGFKIPSGMSGMVYTFLIVKQVKGKFRDEWTNFYAKSTDDFLTRLKGAIFLTWALQHIPKCYGLHAAGLQLIRKVRPNGMWDEYFIISSSRICDSRPILIGLLKHRRGRKEPCKINLNFCRKESCLESI
jgi:hypothetical protein